MGRHARTPVRSAQRVCAASCQRARPVGVGGTGGASGANRTGITGSGIGLIRPSMAMRACIVYTGTIPLSATVTPPGANGGKPLTSGVPVLRQSRCPVRMARAHDTGTCNLTFEHPLCLSAIPTYLRNGVVSCRHSIARVHTYIRAQACSALQTMLSLCCSTSMLFCPDIRAQIV
jgi:hypothetical protein